MFERTLQDLIRGLRAHRASSKAQEDAFLQEALGEIRDELKGKDMALKAEGILKVCYLMMLYPIPAPPGFAFHVVEVMSSPRYHLKQLGYMAAPMAFSGETEEVVLTVNGIKKDLLSPHLPLPQLPLTALPHLLALSYSLSHTLHADLLHLLTHSSPRIRKRAIICLLPCWEAFPEGLREGFPRLREKLLDDDQGVVGATVGVVMELARRHGGQAYLPLAPELFGILTGSSNNWLLIKAVKLFAILTPLEPRLVRKLLPPITSLISSTSAISLLYECVRTCIVGGMLDPDRPEGEALARVCVEKLGGYLRDEGGDQNLRYIALLAMVRIIPTHPHMISDYQEEVLQSLDDPDVSIRIRALELVTSMVDTRNIQSIVDQLLSHLAPTKSNSSALPSAAASLAAIHIASSPSSSPPTTAAALSPTPAYRLLLTQRLLGLVSQDTYIHVTDFQWLISVLVDVAYVCEVCVGREIKDLLQDIVARVKGVRSFAVSTLEKVLGDDGLREKVRDDGEGIKADEGLLEVAVWICGEYPDRLSSPLTTISSILSSSLGHSSSNLVLTSLFAVGKIFGQHTATVSSAYTPETHAETKHLAASFKRDLETFVHHSDIEVQERAVELLQLLGFVEADLDNHVPKRKRTAEIAGVEGGFEEAEDGPSYPKSLFLFQPLFAGYELNAVAANAQSSIPVPEGLDLEHDLVPGGGFPVNLEVETEGSEGEGDADMGERGGKGMDELRKVLREQENGGKDGRKKAKGKGRKGEGEVTPVEDKEARAKRRAAKKAKANDDPYYLYDEKDEAVDEVDDIPIVRLDNEELVTAAAAEDAPSKTRRPIQLASQEIDRSGEMPENATPLRPTDDTEQVGSGLAAVDMSTMLASRTSSTSRFQEYDVDGADEKTAVIQPSAAEVVEVVKVKKKKKKKVPRE